MHVCFIITISRGLQSQRSVAQEGLRSKLVIGHWLGGDTGWLECPAIAFLAWVSGYTGGHIRPVIVHLTITWLTVYVRVMIPDLYQFSRFVRTRYLRF